MAYAAAIDDIIARLKVDIQGVVGIAAAQVHTTRRHLDDPATFNALFWDSTTKRIHGWQIDAVAVPDADFTSTGMNLVQQWWEVEIEGFYEVNDPQTGTASTSGAAWQVLVSTVIAAIYHDALTDSPLNGTAVQTGPITVDEFAEEILGDPPVLVHHCTLRLQVMEVYEP